jgi:hypothetical protein
VREDESVRVRLGWLKLIAVDMYHVIFIGTETSCDIDITTGDYISVNSISPEGVQNLKYLLLQTELNLIISLEHKHHECTTNFVHGRAPACAYLTPALWEAALILHSAKVVGVKY